MANGQGNRNPNQVGAAWKRTSKDGQTTYLSMKLDLSGKDMDLSNINVSLFKNRNKQRSNQPDYIALLSAYQPRQANPQPQQPVQQPVQQESVQQPSQPNPDDPF